jgi:ketosteroid isomerase-like protein
MEHANVQRIKDGYAAFAAGNFEVLNDFFADDVVWHVQGRNQLVGDYHGRDDVYAFFGRLMEITGGTFSLEVHAVLADDEHGVALVTATGTRDERTITTQDAQVFHLRDGRVTEFWNATTDQNAGDELFS